LILLDRFFSVLEKASDFNREKTQAISRLVFIFLNKEKIWLLKLLVGALCAL